MNQTATTLLERAWQFMGFEYLSDLRFISGEERRILSQCFREIEPESYTTFQWNDALAYRQSSSPKHKRFSLSDSPEQTGFEQNLLLFPGVNVSMPDGTVIRAVAFSSGDYPAINIYRMGKTGDIYEKLCFVEFNPEKEDGRRICIGTYCSEQDDTTYYSSYEVGEENEES